MNKIQTAHLNRIQEQFREEHTAKFVAGTIEHKTSLSEDYDAEELLGFLIEEILDLTSYAYTLREILRNERS